jgi:hypothetical protein
MVFSFRDRVESGPRRRPIRGEEASRVCQNPKAGTLNDVADFSVGGKGAKLAFPANDGRGGDIPFP